MKKILFIDTETGGVDPLKHSLLSVGLAVCVDGLIVAQTEIRISEKDYKITKKAMSINKIDLSEHNFDAVTSRVAVMKIIEFVKQQFGEDKATLAGHNVSFDISFIKQLFRRNRRSFRELFSHRYIDTSSILSFLYISGVLDQPIESSSEAFKYFNIKVNGRHTAIGDTIATVILFSKLQDLVKLKMHQNVK